ncbi:amidohydrolase [Pedobacter sp. SYP-B3415]|uniref:amidohydrolase family protein n=1 Tax=Pedobacter sp. SYP-B3415 TaxID=2496641 RepID=UPI00101D681D|nr:amidohydrolase family protein [Pedobacter sp. SYP-B3415]
MIDSHVHFWNYDPVRDAWITTDMQLIRRDFLPADFRAANAEAGCIAVQASQSEAETDFLLQLAGEDDVIRGIVGWVDLRAADVGERLAYYRQFPIIRGFRHVVQGEPAGFLLRPEFLNGIRELTGAGFTYDILVYHHQLDDVIRFLEQFPGQRFVIDHGAKPGIAAGLIDDWAEKMRTIAQHPAIYCKASGLLTEADWARWKPETIFPYLDVLFDCFGSRRLMFGSDWPVVQVAGGYRAWLALLQDYLKDFSEPDKRAFFSDNATAFYKLS